VTEPVYYFRVARYSTTGGRLLRRTWEVTDGIGGRVLLSGRALTRRGAERAAAEAAATCRPGPVGIHRCDLPVRHLLSQMEAYSLTRRLDRDGVPVTVRVDGPDGGPKRVVLWPALRLSTRQQAHTLRLVTAETDAPVRWAGAAR
jgi:hypothetical protein